MHSYVPSLQPVMSTNTDGGMPAACRCLFVVQQQEENSSEW